MRSSSSTVLESSSASGSLVTGRARGLQTFMIAQRLLLRFSRSSAATLFSSTVMAPVLLLSQCAKIVGPGAATVSLSFKPSACSFTALAKCRRTRCENGRTSVAPDLYSEKMSFCKDHVMDLSRRTYTCFTAAIVSGKTTFLMWSSVSSTSSSDQCPCNTVKPFLSSVKFFSCPRKSFIIIGLTLNFLL